MCFAALFEGCPRLPAFSSGYFVGFHLQPILFYAPENIESPVIPHWRSCLYNVVWLWVQLRQITNGTVLLFCGAILSQVLLLLTKHSRCKGFLAFPLFQFGQFYELSLFSLLLSLSFLFCLVHI